MIKERVNKLETRSIEIIPYKGEGKNFNEQNPKDLLYQTIRQMYIWNQEGE